MDCNKYCFAGITYSNDSILNVNYIDNKKEGNGQLISKNGIVLADGGVSTLENGTPYFFDFFVLLHSSIHYIYYSIIKSCRSLLSM